MFGVPQLMTGRRIRAGRPTVLTLLAALSRPDVSIAALEAIIVQDIGLSVTLLRYMNSAAVGLHRRISSIRDAIVFLGTETIRSFAYLVSLTAHSQQPTELARIGMVRAKMMELLAPALGRADRATCFTVGLLSVADALLAVPMDALLEELEELDGEVKRALLHRDGALGAQLRFVEQYERGRSTSSTPPRSTRCCCATPISTRWRGPTRHRRASSPPVRARAGTTRCAGPRSRPRGEGRSRIGGRL